MNPEENNQINGSNPNMNQESIKKEGTIGPIIGTVIIILVILAGALYLWGTIKERTAIAPTSDTQSQESPSPDEIEAQSASDNVADIEADLEASNFDSLDQELNDIDKEFDQI